MVVPGLRLKELKFPWVTDPTDKFSKVLCSCLSGLYARSDLAD